MSTNLSLVASILANPRAHVVNREEKMSRTIDKMVQNIDIEAEKLASGRAVAAGNRGYGRKGVRMGD